MLRDDDGFTLVEVIFALMIFAIVMVGAAYGLQASLGVTRDNTLRTQASQLAARELEIVRNEFTSSDDAPGQLGVTSVVHNPHPLPGGTPGQPLNQDGTDFDVKRSVQWLPTGVGRSPCDGNNPEVTYPSMAVNVTVSWSEQGQVKSIENNTVLTPPKGTISGSLGFIAVKVVGADGKGVAGVPVSVAGPGGPQTRETVVDSQDPDGSQNGGCAVFPISTPGTYTVTLNQPGYISYDGHQSTSKTAVVTAGTIQQVPFSYDQVATLDIEQVTKDGWSLPTPVQASTLFNPGLTPLGTRTIAAGTTHVSNLWPYPDGYSGWVGSCAENDPSASGGSRAVPVVVAPGATETLSLPLTPVTATVVNSTGDPQPGKTVVAEITVDTNPGTGVTTSRTCGVLVLGTTGSDGEVRSSLPAGQWWLRLGWEGMCPALPVPDTGGSTDGMCLRTPALTGSQTVVDLPPIVRDS